ncbi:c-type cytochrome [Flavobacterium hiemivividum]|uniref:Cytochrome c n=1 Tax=Flavobacterium hiemivividum TaxID=2541734 RepID=A0A4R5D591_9FLAO|nr:cytochrome c [Flavobacterium hiemivividum]TDE06751.1 cytochrome c [Flavobacterium hiemivividum]
MITKITLGIALFVSGGFCVFNPSPLLNTQSQNDYLPLKTVVQEKTPLQKSIENGKEVYADFCIQCHAGNGKGDATNFPPLDGSDWLTSKRAESIHAVKFGQKGEILVNKKKYNGNMPAMGLSNQEVADVMNYIMNSWSNKQSKMVTIGEVEAIKK